MADVDAIRAAKGLPHGPPQARPAPKPKAPARPIEKGGLPRVPGRPAPKPRAPTRPSTTTSGIRGPIAAITGPRIHPASPRQLLPYIGPPGAGNTRALRLMGGQPIITPPPVARVERRVLARPVPARYQINPRGQQPAASARDRAAAATALGQKLRRAYMGPGGAADLITTVAGSTPARILQGGARDAADIVTGLPSFAVLAGKNLAAGPAGAYGLLPGVPGAKAARGFANDVAAEDVAVGKGIARDYATRYGPAVRSLLAGHPGAAAANLGRAFVQHPVLTGLDAAAAAGLAGTAVRLGEVGGRAVGAAARGASVRAAVRDALREQRSVLPGARRYRPPKETTIPLGENADAGSTIVEPRTPYPINPIGRGLQKGAARVTAPVGRRVAAYVESHPRLAASPIGATARAQRAAGRVGREVGIASQARVGQQVEAMTQRYADTIRALETHIGADLRHHPHEADALFLHNEGLLDVPGMTPVQARDAVLAKWRQGVAELKAEGRRTGRIEQQIERFAQIPPDLLDVRTAPARLQAAVREAKALDLATREVAVGAGVLSPETAAARARLSAEVVHGGKVYDPRMVRQTPEVAAAQAAYDEARAALRGARTATPRLKTLRAAEEAGRRYGRAEVRLAQAPSIRPPRNPGPSIAGEPGVRGVPIEQRGISAAQARAYRSQGLAKGRMYELRQRTRGGAPKDILAAHRQVLETRRALARAKAEAKGGFAAPVRESGPGGIYQPHVPLEKPVGGRKPLGSSRGRLSGPAPVHQSRASLIGSGNVTASPRLPILATHRAVEAAEASRSIGELIERTAARDESGRILVGARARMAWQADPEHWTLVSKATLQKGLQGLARRSEESGQHPAVSQWLSDTVDAISDATAHDAVAVPTRALSEWRGTTTRIPGYDPLLSLWKSSLLALSPRWYVHNVIGNAAQYLTQAGADIRSIRMAARIPREALPPEVEASFSREAGGAVASAPSLGRRGLGRVMDAGFRINNRMEGIFRRASYIHAARKGLRQEGLRADAEALRDLAGRAAKGDPEALAVVRHAVEEMHRFLGDYTNFSRAEREVLKRIFPFYSWLRVIGRLTLSLPVRNPIRTMALSDIGRAAEAQENPLDFLRPIWERGAVRLPGGLAFPTTSANPYATYQDELAAVGAGGISAVVGALAQQAAPPLAAYAAYATGRQPFGERDFTAPLGYGGTTQMYGREPLKYNPVTGAYESVHPKPSLLEYALQQVPFVPQIRSLASGGRTPYDTASTLDLVRHAVGGGGDLSQLFLPQSRRPRGSSNIPLVTPLSGLAGFGVKRYSDRGALDRAVQDARNDVLGARANLGALARRWAQEGMPPATRAAHSRALVEAIAQKVKRLEALERMQREMVGAAR